MPLQLDDLAALDAPAPEASGQPLMLAIDVIDEDPDQPRREFDADALQELADTIRERGLRQPVSVRPNPERPGCWILNFGARRLRAARLAGLTQIPAFVDTTADHYDQVIENEQREGLKPLEMALFVSKRLNLGESQAEIARRLGKSRQWVTLATAMIEPPNWLLELYRQGRCRGMRELYELRRLHAEQPRTVGTWLSKQDSISREAVAALRAELAGATPDPAHGDAPPAESAAGGRSGDVVEGAPTSPTAASARPERRTSRRLHVQMDGKDYQLDVSLAPREERHVYVRPLEGGQRLLVPAAALTLLGFVSG
jgi:ParB family chromosome partitioning protein